MKCQEQSCAGNDNLCRRSVSLMVNSPISTQPMGDFAFGCDIKEVIDQAVIRLTQMDALMRAGKTSGPSESDRELFKDLDRLFHVPVHAETLLRFYVITAEPRFPVRADENQQQLRFATLPLLSTSFSLAAVNIL